MLPLALYITEAHVFINKKVQSKDPKYLTQAERLHCLFLAVSSRFVMSGLSDWRVLAGVFLNNWGLIIFLCRDADVQVRGDSDPGSSRRGGVCAGVPAGAGSLEPGEGGSAEPGPAAVLAPGARPLDRTGAAGGTLHRHALGQVHEEGRRELYLGR